MQTRWFTGHDLFNFCQVLHPKMSFCMVCGVVRWCCRVCQSKNWVMCTIWILWVLKLWNAKITNWKKLHETFLNSQCFFWIQKTAHIYYCKIYSCMKLEPQGAAQGTIRNMNDDLLLNLLEDRELSLLQNATAFVGFHFLGVFSICHFESTLPSLSASWVGSRQAWAVPCRICSMVFASRMPPPLQEKMFVPQWYFLFFIALLDFLQLRHLLIPWDRSRNHSVWPWHHMGVSKNRDTPNWMVYDEKPIKMDALGVPLFRKHPYFDPLEYVHHVFFVRFQHRRTAAEIHRCRKGQRTDIKPPATKHSAVSFDVFFFCMFNLHFWQGRIGQNTVMRKMMMPNSQKLVHKSFEARWSCAVLFCSSGSEAWDCIRFANSSNSTGIHLRHFTQSLGSFGNAPLNETICSVTRMTSCIFVVVWNCWHAMKIQLSTRDFFEGKRLASSRYAQATCLFQVWSGEEERHYARAVFQGMAAMAIPRENISAVLVGVCLPRNLLRRRGQSSSRPGRQCDRSETWKKFNAWSRRMPVPNGQHPADGRCMLLKKGNPIKVYSVGLNQWTYLLAYHTHCAAGFGISTSKWGLGFSS